MHFNPRPPHGGRHYHLDDCGVPIIISIHVPRMGDDGATTFLRLWGEPISIHVPRMGDDNEGYPALNGWAISIHVPRMGDDSRGLQL